MTEQRWTLSEVNLAALLILKDPLQQSLTHKTQHWSHYNGSMLMSTPIAVADFTMWRLVPHASLWKLAEKVHVLDPSRKHTGYQHADSSLHVVSGSNYSSVMKTNLQLGVCGLWMTIEHREKLSLCGSECYTWSTTESESSVDSSVEVRQTMQQQLFQWGSRLCLCCVLELHNAMAWSRKWHIP